MKKIKFLSLILPVITIILEILPYGAVLNFANPEGEPWRETYSYFSLTPFGYANFAPFITGLLTCIILIVLTVYCITENRRAVLTAKVLLCACILFSLGPLMLGVNYLSVISIGITISLVSELILLHLITRDRSIQ